MVWEESTWAQLRQEARALQESANSPERESTPASVYTVQSTPSGKQKIGNTSTVLSKTFLRFNPKGFVYPQAHPKPQEIFFSFQTVQ